MNNFAVFILSHGRAGNICTIQTLHKHGYTGDIIIVVDNEDKTSEDYFEQYDNVQIFNKEKIALTFDEADNLQDRRTIVYARNACFEIAKKLGYKYFMQLDDDYTYFEYRIYNSKRQKPQKIYSLDSVFIALLEFYKSTKFDTISIAQGGDFIGGKENRMAKKPTIFRKCMNSFICSTEKPFKFVGRINEDVNTYVYKQSIGLLMGTIPFIALGQKTTQKNKGGMTDIYINSGTYVKSFYTVMFHPSSTYIKPMGDKKYRLHHCVQWDKAVPKIVKEN